MSKNPLPTSIVGGESRHMNGGETGHGHYLALALNPTWSLYDGPMRSIRLYLDKTLLPCEWNYFRYLEIITTTTTKETLRCSITETLIHTTETGT
jgi:hypothetical protein